MPTFIISMSWTEEGLLSAKDAPKRAQAARDLAKKVGVVMKEVYFTSGKTDFINIIEAPSGDHAAKFAMSLGMQGKWRTRTALAWSEAEFQKLLSELP